EHEVLEQVSEAGAPRLLVLGPDVVPDIDRHQRTGTILVEDHGQPVRQHELFEGNLPHGGALPTGVAARIAPRRYRGSSTYNGAGIQVISDVVSCVTWYAASVSIGDAGVGDGRAGRAGRPGRRRWRLSGFVAYPATRHAYPSHRSGDQHRPDHLRGRRGHLGVGLRTPG